MSDIMRQEYKQLTKEESELVLFIKQKGDAFYAMLESALPDCRETSLAKTKIEEAVMWAVKAIT